MKSKSSIEKGKRLEKWIIDELFEYAIDLNARRESGSGNGKRKGDLSSSIDFLIEAKNQKKPNWLDTIDQAKRQARSGFYNPDKWLAVIRDPREPEFHTVYAVLDIHQFLMLYKKAMEPRTDNPDRQFSYLLNRLVQDIKQLKKYLPDA